MISHQLCHWADHCISVIR